MTATSTQDETKSGSTGVTVTAPTSVVISPSSMSVQVFHQQQFTAMLAGSPGSAFLWSVNGVPNGNLQLGEVDSTGLYTAPNSVPSPALVTLTATDPSDASETASVTVSIAADAAPPAIESELPNADQTGVSLDSTILIAFRDALDPTTVTPGNFTLTDASGAAVGISVSYDPAAYSVTIIPGSLLSAGTSYTVNVANAVADPAGETLPTPTSWSFTTQSAVTANASIGTALVQDPTTVTVISYGGLETIPDSSGNFSVSVSPLGSSMIEAMVPGKNFGWMALAADQSSATSQSALGRARQTLGQLQTRRDLSQVAVTRYQITSSRQAAATPGQITADATTTAEAMLFMTPYFFTTDPTQAATIQLAIAGDPTIPALTQAITGAAGEADPLSDSNVKSALAASVTSIWSTLTSPGAQAAESGLPAENRAAAAGADGGTALGAGRIHSLDNSSSLTVASTPYCYGSDAQNTTNQSLPCLDLDFMRLSPQGVQNGAFVFKISDNACAHGNPWSANSLFGCAVDWLVMIGPKDGSWNPPGGVQGVGVDQGGGGGGLPSSPVGTFDPNCSDTSPSGCLNILQMNGPSTFEYLNLNRDLSLFVTAALGLPVNSGTTFQVPYTSGNYVMRAYSGGINDWGELQNVLANKYDGNSRQLWFHALSNNMGHIVLDAIGAGAPFLGLSGDAVTKCMAHLVGTADTLDQQLQQSLDASASGTVQQSIQTLLDKVVEPVLAGAEPCGADVAKSEASNWWKGLWNDSFGAVVTALDAGRVVGEATQKIGQLLSATPVETAVITVQPIATTGTLPTTIEDILPNPMTTGNGAQAVMIDGSGFPANAMVWWKDPAGNVTGPISPTAPVTLTTFRGSENFVGKPGQWYVKIGDSSVNSGWFGFQVQTGNAASPDLVPQGVMVSPASVAAGGSITVNFTVANIGSGDAGSSVTGFRLGTSQTISPGRSGDIPNSLVATRALAAGTSVQQSQTLTLPASIPAGTYYVWVVVDDVVNSTLGQSNTTNDYAPSNALTVTAGQNAAPQILGVAPNPVPASSMAAPLTINGTNFEQNATLVFHDPQKNQYLRSAKYVSATTLIHPFDDAADVGMWTVEVQNPDGQQSNVYSFSVSNTTNAPILQQIVTAPNPPLPGQPFTLTLTGSGFDASSSEILISGSGCAPCTIANHALTTDTTVQMAATVTLNAGGTYSVMVEDVAAGTQSNALAFSVGTSLVPLVSYISPTTATANSSSNPNATQTVSIYGSNFAASNVVQFYRTQGSNAYSWNSSNSTPTVTPTLITIPMNPGTVAETIRVRVCESATQTTAGTCSSGIQAVTVTPGGGSVATNVRISENQGFDLAFAPAESDLAVWVQSSPYRDIGVYIGGCNVTAVPATGPNGCGSNPASAGTKKTNTNLTPKWVQDVSGMGWGIMPLWVGPQASCISSNDPTGFYWIDTSTSSSAYNEGMSEADSAAAAAAALGMGNSVLYYDMEAYATTDAGCDAVVDQFLGGWISELRAKGFLAGVYATPYNANQWTNQPDAIWAYVPDNVNTASDLNNYLQGNWAQKRIHQYCGGGAAQICPSPAEQTYGNVTLGQLPNHGLDLDVEDGPVFATGTVSSGAATVSGVLPNPVPGNNSNQTLTISGSGFATNATVSYHDPVTNQSYPAHAASVSNSNTIVDTQFDDGGDAGTWTVTVTNPGASPSNSYPFTVQASNAFTVGEYVVVTGTNGVGLNLRSCASTSCPSLVKMPDGTVMQVIGGPTTAGGYTWWQLSGFVQGTSYSGWADQTFLSSY